MARRRGNGAAERPATYLPICPTGPPIGTAATLLRLCRSGPRRRGGAEHGCAAIHPAEAPPWPGPRRSGAPARRARALPRRLPLPREGRTGRRAAGTGGAGAAGMAGRAAARQEQAARARPAWPDGPPAPPGPRPSQTWGEAGSLVYDRDGRRRGGPGHSLAGTSRGGALAALARR